VFVLDRAGITGDDGASHHGILDLALSLRIPTMTVLAPSLRGGPRGAAARAVDLDGPVLLRFPKGTVVTADDLGIDGGPGVDRGSPPASCATASDVCVLAVGDRVGPGARGRGPARPRTASRRRSGTCAACGPPTRHAGRAAAAPLVVTVENGLVGGGAGSGARRPDRRARRGPAGPAGAAARRARRLPAARQAGPHPGRARARRAGIAAATRKVLADDADRATVRSVRGGSRGRCTDRSAGAVAPRRASVDHARPNEERTCCGT
jgi:1-deoxy-D-xylulose-5-phosphate synthase